MHKKWAFVIAALVCGVAGCTLDSIPDRGEPCPGQSEDGKLAFIQVDSETRCDKEKCPEYAESFELNVCPPNISTCQQTFDEQYYCIECSDNQVACDGQCVDPNSNDHCGAKGKCISSDIDSPDFWGKKCDSDQRCEEGTCTVTQCNGIICKGDCVRNPATDPDYCGAQGDCNSTNPESRHFEGVQCSAHSSCKDGKCTCDDDYIKCGEECINPDSNREHCGARGLCNSDDKNDDNFVGFTCTENERCNAGKCVLKQCEAGKELCTDNDNNRVCKDLLTDIYNCGGCNRECTPSEEGKLVSACLDGECIFECDTDNGYHKCENEGYFNCLHTSRLQTDLNNCGECGNVCDTNETCSDGICKPAVCDEKQCRLDNGTCLINDATACGPACKNCNSTDVIPNVASGQCNNGECTAKICMENYHLDGLGGCIGNTSTSCAPTNSEITKDCTKEISSGNGKCIEGTCQLSGCSIGFHEFSGECEPNTDSNCGVHGKTCSIEGGIAECDVSAGTCQLKGCSANYHEYNGTCEANSEANCGQHGKICNYTGGTGICNVSTGTCQLAGCNTGYHEYGGECEANNNSNCGRHGNVCSISGGNAACDTNSGTCQLVSCNDNYHQNNNSCERDTLDHCGSNNFSCPSGSTSCENGKCYKNSKVCFTYGSDIDCSKGIYPARGVSSKCVYDPEHAIRGEWTCECTDPTQHMFSTKSCGGTKLTCNGYCSNG